MDPQTETWMDGQTPGRTDTRTDRLIPVYPQKHSFYRSTKTFVSKGYNYCLRRYCHCSKTPRIYDPTHIEISANPTNEIL